MLSKGGLSAIGAPMGAMLSCFMYEGAAYNVIFLGRVLKAEEKEWLILPFAVLFNVLFGLALWSYLRAHTTDPGSVPKRWQDFVCSVGDLLPVAPPRPEWQPGLGTYCNRCDLVRPERAHHCNSCGICVLRMDHHCAWISNCVGFNNHKFFLLVGIYATVASIVALATSFMELVSCAASLTGAEEGLSWEEKRLQKTDVLAFLIFGALTLFFVMILVPMLATHLPYAFKNLTAIESNYINMPNPFDRGSKLDNLSQILGACGPDWLVPVKPWRPLTDGVCFARMDELPGACSTLDLPLSPEEGEDEPELERFWRIRYHVRSRPTPRDEIQEERGPLASLTSWWRSANNSDFASGSKRSLSIDIF